MGSSSCRGIVQTSERGRKVAKDKVKELPRVTNISSAGRPKTPKKTGGKALLFARVAQQVVQEVRAKRESILKKANTHPGGSFADRLEALEEKLSEGEGSLPT